MYADNKIWVAQKVEPFGHLILVWQTFLWRKVSSVFVGCLKNDEREMWVASFLVAKLCALDELFELPLLIYHIVIIHNRKFIHNLIDNKKISTTMGSNTGFLGENPIRKGKIPTSYGFFLCTQFSPLLKFFKE